jgi:hypothetical protein
MTDSDNKTRASRDSETHDKQARRRPWRPVRKLETPPGTPRLHLSVDSGINARARGSGERKQTDKGRLGACKIVRSSFGVGTSHDGCRKARWSHIQRRVIACENTKRNDLTSAAHIIMRKIKRPLTHWITQCLMRLAATGVTLSMIRSEIPK